MELLPHSTVVIKMAHSNTLPERGRPAPFSWLHGHPTVAPWEAREVPRREGSAGTELELGKPWRSALESAHLGPL